MKTRGKAVRKRKKEARTSKEEERSKTKKDPQTKTVWTLALLRDSGNGRQSKEISKLEQSGPFPVHWRVATDSNTDGPVPVDAQPNKQKTRRRNKGQKE